MPDFFRGEGSWLCHNIINLIPLLGSVVNQSDPLIGGQLFD